MARTTSGAVIGILLDDYDAENTPDVTPFIETASAMTDDLNSYAIARSITLSATKLELIERWLAAWAYCQSDQPYIQKSTGESSATFQGKSGLKLDSNKYGQTATVLDSSGYLTSLNSTFTVDAFWLGKPVSQQIPYDQRN